MRLNQQHMKSKLFFCIVLILCFQKIKAQETFCAICSREAWAGDSAALNKFMSSCGVVDTVGYDSLNIPSTKNPVFKKVTMKLNSGKILFTDDIFIVPDKMPEYVGGEKAILHFLKNNLKAPSGTAVDIIQGTVYVQLIVEKDGQTSHVTIKRSLQSDVDMEAVRVVKQFPKWKPGMYKGKPVRVQMALPVYIDLK